MNFFEPETTCRGSKVSFVYQEALFAKPEVTTFIPEVKILKPEVRVMTNKNSHVPKNHFYGPKGA